MVSEYAEDDRPEIDARRLWAGGAATAVVAALIAVVGILLARGVLRAAVFAPERAGVWGNANTVTYAVSAAAVALLATGVLHFLLVTTPRATVFFGWIMVLLTIIAVVVPWSVIGTTTGLIATVTINVLIGLVVTSLLIGVVSAARSYRRPRYRPPAYESDEWQP